MIVGVTGGTGFIGGALTRRHLADGDRVRLLTRGGRSTASISPGVDLHLGDLVDAESQLGGFVDGLDVLYHCAAEIRDPARMRAVQVDGTAHLVQAAAGRVGRWVQLSSVGVYGPHRAGIVTEETPLTPSGPYEETKAESDALVAAAASADAFQVAVLRPSIVFGEGMTNRSLHGLIEAVRRGLFVFVGRPGASANYVHVDDVVEALVLCGARPAAAGLTVNLSDWSTIEDFVGLIASALGRPTPTRRLPEGPARLVARAGARLPRFPLTGSRVNALTSRARYPTDRIERTLGYRHVVSQEEGLRRLIAEGSPR